MKKKLAILLSCLLVILLCIPVFAACTPRSQILKIGNWEGYIESSVKDKFEEYYFNLTGEKVEVQYIELQTNEDMYTNIAVRRTDYDLVCPSDYMIEKMIRENLLFETEKDLGEDINGNVIEDYRSNVSDFAKGRPFDPQLKYSVPYMWGTMGILYNENELNDSQKVDNDNNGTPDIMQNWNALWNTQFKGKILMKDSYRDSFVPATFVAYADEIEAKYNEIYAKNTTLKEKQDEYNAYLTSLLNATDSNNINRIKDVLINQKKTVLQAYEVDNGKDMMASGVSHLALQWAGDAAYTDTLSDRTLHYSIPDAGSNLFFDGWVIPKYAQNTRAANLFMNFICRPDIAILNMDDIMYTTVVSSPEVIDYLNETYADYPTIDVSYIFGEAGKAVQVNPAMYPDFDTIMKCVVMRDFGSAESAMNDMWTEVLAS